MQKKQSKILNGKQDKEYIMKMQEKMILATYIASKHGVEYEWGINDCNTFVFEFHDQAYGTNLMSLCKYRDKRSAMKFSKGYCTLNQWMNIHEYKAKPKSGKNKDWREGDIAIQTMKPWYNSAFIYHNGAFWAMAEGKGLNNYTVKAVESVMTSAWRKDSGAEEVDTVEFKEEVELAVEETVEPAYETPEESEAALETEESDWIDDNTCEDCNEFPCECDRPAE